MSEGYKGELQSGLNRAWVPVPNPDPTEIQHPAFSTVWNAIKRWDINIPQSYNGYMGATGSHVKIILDALWNAAYPGQPQFWGGKIVTPATGTDGRDWYKVRWPHHVRWQRFVDAWLCLTGKWSLHRAWQRGYDHGTSSEYYRTHVMRGN